MTRTLQDKIDAAPSVRDMLRNAPTGYYQFPVPSEHTNWRDEQLAWAETAALFDQSYHMTDLNISGPDTKRLLAETSINNYDDFTPLKAFQYVAVAANGKIIGDAIGFLYRDGSVTIVGKPTVASYLMWRVETGKYDVTLRNDIRVVEGNSQRANFRLQVQGPNAGKILEKVNGGPLPETRFFGMCEFTIAGRKVTGLRHGMAGAPGMEFWGPYADKPAVLDALMKAGEEYGLRRGGFRTYSTSGPQSGWVGAVVPAVYTGDDMAGFRKWLPETSYEATASLGGSLLRDDMDDYYLDPWDVGYHRLIHWDHDFHGKEGLAARKDTPHRRKVWLKWHPDDVLRIVKSQLTGGERYKFLEWPMAGYASLPYDEVHAKDGKPVGLSIYGCYTVHAGWFSIGILEENAKLGDEVVITWGEPDVTRKPTVEPHVQTTIRATVTRTALG